MNRIREQLLPILGHWITFLTHALPLRSVPTLIERVVGALLSRRGWVTEAYRALAAQRHWTSYYQWWQHGRSSWLRLGQDLAVVLPCSFPRRVWYLVEDDCLNCRASRQAPSGGRHHHHSRTVNRPKVLPGQCGVLLAAVLSRGRWYGSALPRLARLQRTVGNRSQVRAAGVLLRAVGAILQDCQVRVLLAGGYLRRRVIQYAHAWRGAVIGQVRRDTAL